MPGPAFSKDYELFVDLLIEVRKEAGITQEQLAQRLGKPQSYISKSERRERRVDVVEFCTLAEAMDVRPAEFIDRFIRARDQKIEIYRS